MSQVNPDDIDAICEKANTIRRYWEQALKIEIVYRDLRPKKSYSVLVMGDLISLLRDFHQRTDGVPIGQLVGWANELSHDAGRAIDPEKARRIAIHVLGHVGNLRNEIRRDPVPRGKP